MQRVRSYATRSGLTGHTRNSITEVAALERELSNVLARGTARDDQELEVGVRCIAADIYDDQGLLVIGRSISTPANRLENGWLERLRDTADQISTLLGHQRALAIGDAAAPKTTTLRAPAQGHGTPVLARQAA